MDLVQIEFGCGCPTNNQHKPTHQTQRSAMARNYDSVESDTDAENEANKNAGWMKTRYWSIFYIFTLLIVSLLVYIILDEDKKLTATIVNVAHGVITYYACHYRKGTELGGADDTLNDYDEMTFWQQLDGGYSWTSNKKVLTLVPLVM